MNNIGKMKMIKKFSFPINIEKILKNQIIDIDWFKKHSELIHEVYISPAFMNIISSDMNGPETDLIFSTPDDIFNFLSDIKSLGIKICVTFNDTNILISDVTEKLELPKYKNLIDILIVPNKDWLIFKNFVIKNTVINLPTYNDIKNGLYDDYDMIYIHDEIIHNHDKYLKLKKLKNYKFGTVVNYEDCSTSCKFKDMHYSAIKDNVNESVTFCPTLNYSPIELLLKRNNIPGYLSEYLYYADTIDIFKLQGRNTTGNTFMSAISIVENILECNEYLTNDYKNLKLPNKIDLIKWKIEVRNCGGNCEHCSYCDNILKGIE